MNQIPTNAILCFISNYDNGSVAYFTTQTLSEQHGDDWGKYNYPNNAGIPYRDRNVPPQWQIFRVTWEGDFNTPEYTYREVPNVHEMNRCQYPWLWSCKPTGPAVLIWAGTTFDDFKRMIEESGGKITHTELIND